jgi:anti-sigma B factor antagonist
MEFPSVRIQGVCVVRVPEDALNAANSSQFKSAIRPLLEENDTVVLDMGGIQFLDSAGCGALLSCLRHMSGKNGDLRLCSVQNPVLTLFKLVRIDWIIPIYGSRDEAVQALPGDRPAHRP